MEGMGHLNWGARVGDITDRGIFLFMFNQSWYNMGRTKIKRGWESDRQEDSQTDRPPTDTDRIPPPPNSVDIHTEFRSFCGDTRRIFGKMTAWHWNAAGVRFHAVRSPVGPRPGSGPLRSPSGHVQMADAGSQKWSRVQVPRGAITSPSSNSTSPTKYKRHPLPTNPF